MENLKNAGFSALSISAFSAGIAMLINGGNPWYVGSILIAAGAVIEFLKYLLRK